MLFCAIDEFYNFSENPYTAQVTKPAVPVKNLKILNFFGLWTGFTFCKKVLNPLPAKFTSTLYRYK